MGEYISNSRGFEKIIEYKNIEYAPLLIKNKYEKSMDIVDDLTEWFKGRGIPSWRDKLDLLLSRLNITYPTDLLDKAFGLSLSDQYWIKPYGSNIKYDDINFFDHDFDASEFVEATFSNTGTTIKSENALKTPNNTTDGMLKKSWVIEDNKRILIKGGYKNELLQPFNEVLASNICNRLGFDHVEYKLDVLKGNVVSKCVCFINKNTEFIPVHQILHNVINDNEKEDAYEKYIEILENHNIKNVREKLDDMFMLDYLIMNEDRHLNNFGIIRDVNTLKWIDIAPIFDNGQALNLPYYNDDEVHISCEGRFFYDVKKFDDIIKVVKNIKRIDVKKLDDIASEFDNLLHKYQGITHMSDNRINILCTLLNKQINKLKELVNN